MSEPSGWGAGGELPQDALLVKEVLESMVGCVQLLQSTAAAGAGTSARPALELSWRSAPAGCPPSPLPLAAPSSTTCTTPPSPAANPRLQGVKQYEPRVLQQLMDFMYRYTAEILQDAEVRAGCAWAGTKALGDLLVAATLGSGAPRGSAFACAVAAITEAAQRAAGGAGRRGRARA